MQPDRTRAELDQMVVGIELTLVSIIQGVALAVLIENASKIVDQRDIAAWPYVFAGLFTIFVFWSRAVLHIITLIRWPLEFGHNFLYIGCALVEALSFAQLANPERWFVSGSVFIAVGWALFFYDLRLIRARQQDSAGETANELLRLVWRDQMLNLIVLLPAIFFFDLACALAIHFRIVHADNRHLWLAGAQVAGFVGYLIYVVRFYTKISPLIGAARQQWDRTDHA
jgi:hypothetical protein